MQRPSSLNGRWALPGDEQERLFPLSPILPVPGIVYKAESYIHPPALNIQPPSVFIYEFQISSSKVTEEAVAFGSAINNFF